MKMLLGILCRKMTGLELTASVEGGALHLVIRSKPTPALKRVNPGRSDEYRYP